MTLLWSLIGDFTEKLTFSILAAALIPVVGDDRDEIVFDDLLDIIVGECERTARDSIVSSTAERMPVHLPQKNRLALGRCFLASLPQVGLPADLEPFVVLFGRRDGRLHRGECFSVKPGVRRQQQRQRQQHPGHRGMISVFVR